MNIEYWLISFRVESGCLPALHLNNYSTFREKCFAAIFSSSRFSTLLVVSISGDQLAIQVSFLYPPIWPSRRMLFFFKDMLAEQM